MVQFKPKLTCVHAYEKGSMVLVGDHEYDGSSGDESSGDESSGDESSSDESSNDEFEKDDLSEDGDDTEQYEVRGDNGFGAIEKGNVIALYSDANAMELFYLCKVLDFGFCATNSIMSS